LTLWWRSNSFGGEVTVGKPQGIRSLSIYLKNLYELLTVIWGEAVLNEAFPHFIQDNLYLWVTVSPQNKISLK